jgi:hypothetical protein
MDGNRDGPRPDAAKQAAEDKRAKGPQLYQGFLITKSDPAFTFWKVSTEDGSQVPEALAGVFTSIDEVRKAVLTHRSSKAKPDTK